MDKSKRPRRQITKPMRYMSTSDEAPPSKQRKQTKITTGGIDADINELQNTLQEDEEYEEDEQDTEDDENLEKENEQNISLNNSYKHIKQTQHASSHTHTYTDIDTHTNINSHTNEFNLSHTNLQLSHSHSQSYINSQPSHSNSQSYINSQPSHSNSQPSYIINSQLSHSNSQQPHSNSQLSHSNLQPSHTNLQPSHTNLQPLHSNLQPSHSNLQPSHTNLQPSRSNMQSSSINLHTLHSNSQLSHSNVQSSHIDIPTTQVTNINTHSVPYNYKQHTYTPTYIELQNFSSKRNMYSHDRARIENRSRSPPQELESNEYQKVEDLDNRKTHDERFNRIEGQLQNMYTILKDIYKCVKNHQGIPQKPAILPISSCTEMDNFERADEKTYSDVVMYFRHVGGFNLKEAVHLCLKEGLNDAITSFFTWLGTKKGDENKRPLYNSRLIIAIYEAVCNNEHFSKPTRSDFQIHMREALRAAKERQRHRMHRMRGPQAANRIREQDFWSNERREETREENPRREN